MSRLRIERWNNGRTVAVARKGQQDIRYKTIPPTEWVAAVSHPDIGETFCVQSFDSLPARTEFINEILKLI